MEFTEFNPLLVQQKCENIPTELSIIVRWIQLPLINGTTFVSHSTCGAFLLFRYIAKSSQILS